MKNNIDYSPEELQSFENEMAELYSQGNIRFPIHLRGSEDFAYENGFIKFFKKHNITKEDYWFSYWDSHIPALLKGISKDDIKQSIIDGDSIALCFPEFNFYCSGIVASLFGVAVGVAYKLKKEGSSRRVFCYVGDMASFTGTFHESAEYANNWNLPINWLLGDNNLSVMTDTKQTWNKTAKERIAQSPYRNKIDYFQYKNIWPHSGLKQKIAF